MAVVGAAPATITQQASPMRFPELQIPGMMTTAARSTSSSSGESVEVAPVPVARDMEEEKVHVAVGTSVKECKSLVVWALQNSGGKSVCLLHVHQPAQMIPLMGAKFLASALKEQEVRAFRELERQGMRKVLDDYILLCRKMGMRAEKLSTESDSIEKGILELISKHKIRKLVMGAAADRSYKRGMTEIKSKKAMTVRQQAPPYCHILFVCKDRLINTREASADGPNSEAGSSSREPSPSTEIGQPHQQRSRPNSEVGSSSEQASPSTEIGQLYPQRSQSMMLRQNSYVKPTNPAQDLLRRIKSVTVDGHGRRPISSSSLDDAFVLSTSQSGSDAERNYDEFEELSRSASQNSVFSSCFSAEMANGAVIPISTTEGSEFGSDFISLPQDIEDSSHSSPPRDESTTNPYFDQLEQAMSEAMNSRREAFEEAVRRAKAEKVALDAIHKAKALENLYTEESKQRKEIEDALRKEKEELDKMKNVRDGIMVELQNALDQKSSLEQQIAESDEAVKGLEQKIISAVELLQKYKKERDELQIERDNALKEAEELRKSRAEASSSAHQSQFFSEFSFSEIEEATQNFDPSRKIGEGGYGSIYKSLLRHTPVAIKMLHSDSMQGPSEFQQEVDVLSKMRHPNLVTLVGACPEAWTLIYEYLPNGSLEDRLSCRDNSPPLSWQTRIRIATELCSVLIFLHSNKQHSIVHGDLKPGNILLDANLVSKLSDFGICRLLYHTASSSKNTTICYRTDPKGTFAYMDPEFLTTGELTPKSDVYSFGIILLRLLTCRSPFGITKEVRSALDTGNLKSLLDPLAGDWPFVLAEQLAYLALRCCEMNRKNRPDLASEVWRVLEPMKASYGGSPCFQLGSEEHRQPPPYFICPIFQEVMQDPHVAADGFTYEAEALRGWLDSGHDTSPMTNLKLAHCDLVPNRALRSAIQEWLQQQ